MCLPPDQVVGSGYYSVASSVSDTAGAGSVTDEMRWAAHSQPKSAAVTPLLANIYPQFISYIYKTKFIESKNTISMNE